jgi:nicotinate phosphoribosyltransferase
VSYTAESAKKGPTNSMVSPMLTDMYQLSMTYAYWKQGRHNDHAVFDLFFRKNPFKGEFTDFAGLNEVLGLLSTFTFTAEDITFLKEKLMPSCEDDFFNAIPMVGLACTPTIGIALFYELFRAAEPPIAQSRAPIR